MKWILGLMAIFLLSTEARAGRATPFEGWYEIISRRDVAAADGKDYFLLDADPLGVIWDRYAGGRPLPADLEKYRHEPAILAGFTNRDILFLTLEAGATIGTGYLAIEGSGGDRLQLRRRPDGGADLAITEAGRVSLYVVGPARETPESR